jgi:hypothetical protein
MRERRELPGIDRRALRLELLPDQMRQRQVHVVAAEQQVLAHRHAPRLQAAVLLAEQDGGKVAGASADVDHQHQIADRQVRAPGVTSLVEPGIKRGLRLLEQGQLIEPGRERRLHRAFSRGRIERGGHGQHHLLIPQARAIAAPGAPGFTQMLEESKRRLDRRHLRHILGGVQGQYGDVPVHRGMRQPALGARHHAAGGLRSAPAGILADRQRDLGIPGQSQRSFSGVRIVEKRG